MGIVCPARTSLLEKELFHDTERLFPFPALSRTTRGIPCCIPMPELARAEPVQANATTQSLPAQRLHTGRLVDHFRPLRAVLRGCRYQHRANGKGVPDDNISLRTRLLDRRPLPRSLARRKAGSGSCQRSRGACDRPGLPDRRSRVASRLPSGSVTGTTRSEEQRCVVRCRRESWPGRWR
jgi:hypothetical protein